MKLASYDDGSRDGHLVVVSRDLSTAHYASGIATRMQQLLDDWDFLAPQLRELAISLDHGRARHAFPFEPQRCRAPLPRAHHWVSAQAWGAPDAPEPTPGPPVRRGTGDALLGPLARVAAPPGAALDAEAQWVAVCGPLARGASPQEALGRIRLLGLGLDWWLRDADAGRPPSAGSWLASSFSPVLATPDELGTAWQAGRLHRPLALRINGKSLGNCDAGRDMRWHAGQVLAWLARHQPLGTGTLVGLGPVRPRPDPAAPEARPGVACLLDARLAGSRRAWLAEGDVVGLDMAGSDGQSLFGALQAGVELWAPDESADPAAGAAP